MGHAASAKYQVTWRLRMSDPKPRQPKNGRKAARQIIDGGIGSDWILAGSGQKADPYILREIDDNNPMITYPNTECRITAPILAATAAEARQESMFKSVSATEGSAVDKK